MPKNMKRILTVSIVTMHDENPDTSYLGEYGNSPTSPYSIDRAHDLDCPQQTYNGLRDVDGKMVRLAVRDKLGRISDYLCAQFNAQHDNATSTLLEHWDWYNDSSDFISEHIDSLENECTCGNSWNMGRSEYRYFNPSFNYVDDKGKRLPENTPDEVIQYVKQDYQRMEGLKNGNWYYLGIEARAEIQLTLGKLVGSQTITSGGLWGIESDGDYSDIKKEELSALHSQLKALGFGTRAISKAFKSISEKDGN